MNIEISPDGFREALAKVWAAAPHADEVSVEVTILQSKKLIVPDSSGADPAEVIPDPRLEMWLSVTFSGNKIYARDREISGLDMDTALAELTAKIPPPLTPAQIELKKKAAALRAQADALERGQQKETA